MAKHLPTTSISIIAFLIVGSGPAIAECTAGNPTGHFQGTAVSKQAGKLDISLDLRCVDQQYQGELVTPVGVYTVKTGAFAGGELQLQLVSGTDSVAVRARVAGQGLRGEFTSGEDSGPVDLQHTGEPHAFSSMESSVQLTPQQWQEDMDFFARELPRRHANAFHHLTRSQFDAAIADFKHRLPQMNGDEIYVALDRIANSIGDAHTYVEFPQDVANLPLALAKFGEDYRVVSVGTGYEKALGTGVVRIGDTPVAQARQLGLSMTPAPETTALADARVVGFLTMGITLHGLGIIADRNVAPYTLVDDNGKQFTVSFQAMASDAQVNWVNIVKTPPLRQRNPDQNFWYVYLPDSRTVYCNFRDYKGLDQNAAALLSEVKDKDPEKLVIDLRQNGGGDFSQRRESEFGDDLRSPSDHLLFHLSRRAEELRSELGRRPDCRVGSGGGNGQVDFCTGPVSTPDLQFAVRDFSTLLHAMQAEMSVAPACAKDLWIDAPPIIPDAKPELLFLISNTRCHDGNPPHPELAAFAKEQGYEVSNDGLLLTI